MRPELEFGQRLWVTWHREMIPGARLNPAASKLPLVRIQIGKATLGLLHQIK